MFKCKMSKAPGDRRRSAEVPRRVSLRPAHQFRVFSRSETDVRFRSEANIVIRERQPDRNQERRLVEANLGGEGVRGGPGPAGGGWLLRQRPPGRPALLPGAAAAGDP